MSRLLSLIAGIVGAALALVAVGWWRGAIALPFGPSHHELALQLRDRGTVAVAGGVPLGLPRDAAPLVDFDQFPALRSALRGNRGAQAAQAMRDAHLDGLLVRTDHTLSSSGSLLRALSTAQPVDELAATYLDDTAALYEVHDPISIAPGDAPRLIEVVRLVLQGAIPPPERLFPESARRAIPTEVAVIVRDGHEPILWRAVRGGSIARALIDATYAVLDRWNTRQQQSYGPLRDAILTHPITIAIFYDRGTLGTRTPAFLTRAVDPHRYSLGYEYLGRWEYVLPPTPWSQIGNPVRAIQDLAREHDVPAPGYLRPEITIYRFRAYELVERSAQGPVDLFNPS